MSRKKNMLIAVAGILIGVTMSGPAAHAAAEYVKALPSIQTFYLDGQKVELEAYNINGSNYVRLGDLSTMVGFQLSYNGDTNSVYIGEAPEAAKDYVLSIPQSDQKLVLKEGDIIQCDDGSQYKITDMSRYGTSVFTGGLLPELPSPTCDWSRFPQSILPRAETRHFTSQGDILFIRNLHETRRMQYTIYNALGNESSAWSGTTLLAAVELSIPEDLEVYASAFWPWRASELEDLVHSRPNSRFYVEAWDCYLNGVFQHTQYMVCSI